MDDKGQLEELNHEEAKQYIGGTIFVSIIMTIGIIGNLHVLFVYAFRIKPSNHRIFILTLAALDFITCVIGMPFIIVDLRNPLTFTMTSACKVLRFVNYFICISSAFVLIVIASDRYRKICVPLGRQISKKTAKCLCALCLAISFLLSWPAPVLYGHSSVNTTNPNVTGVRCFTEDRFKKTKYQTYFNAVLILCVFGIFSVLVVLYCFIGRTIRNHSNFSSNTFRRIDKGTKSKSTDTTDESSVEEKKPGFRDENMLKTENIKINFINTESSATSTGSSTSVNAKQLPTKTDGKNRDKANFNRRKRTTFMLFLITMFFFISYFPHLTLKIVAFVKKDFVVNLSFTGKVLYNTFVWCFFINNMANCFIYGFCDMRFRTEVKNFYKRIFYRKS